MRGLTEAMGADKGCSPPTSSSTARGSPPCQTKGADAGLLDGGTTRHEGYKVSQRKRKRVEEIFGWMKAYGGLRRTMMRGIERVQLHAHRRAPHLLRLAGCGR